MNNCTFIGRLTMDPEVKTTSSGKALINFSLAVERDYKNADGSRPVDFIPCIAWDPVASIITRFTHKGDKIGITGRFESDNYMDSNGNKKTFYRILINQVDLIQAKSESKPQEAAPVAPRKQIEPAEDIDDRYNGLPFPLEDA